jgi:hypothetical protein
VDGQWQATRIVRIPNDEEGDGGFFQWLFGRRNLSDGVSEVIHAGSCRRFSTSIKRMIFCDEMDELRDGKLVPIGGGKVGLHTFVGDARSVGQALFIGRDGHLYGYDGKEIRQISAADFSLAYVQDLPRIGRTFLVTPSALFELRRTGRGVELIQIEAPPHPSFFGTIFHSAPDGAAALAFLGDGVYQVVGNGLSPIWDSLITT